MWETLLFLQGTAFGRIKLKVNRDKACGTKIIEILYFGFN